MTLRRIWVVVGVVVGIVVLPMIIFRPRVSLTVQQRLVGPEDREVWVLLGKGAPFDQVKQAIVDTGKPVDAITFLGDGVLSEAVHRKRVALATWLLEQGASPNGLDPGNPPLFWAIENDDVEMARLLIRYGADPDLDMGLGRTPRKVAMRRGAKELIEVFNSARDSSHDSE